MRWLLLLALLFPGCAHQPVKKVVWFNTPPPTRNGVYVCTYVYQDRRLICTTLEDYILLAP